MKPVMPRTQEPQEEKREEGKPMVRRREEYRRPEPRSAEEETTQSRPTRRQRLSFQNEERKDNNIAEPKPFNLLPHVNLFDPGSSSRTTDLPAYLAQGTPARPPSPTKGILVTPGVSMGRRKAVTFDPTTKNEEVKSKNPRTRSGLPSDFPGKFPSPWTPRQSGSLEETSLPIKSASRKRAVRFDVTENSRIEDILRESDDDNDKIPVFQDGDLTVDMNAPKSASGIYWKEHAENLEGLAVSKVDKLKDRCNLAIEYAKRKDEFCVNLGEKLREVMDKNKLLKNEIKRLNQISQFSSSPEASALSDAMRMLAEKEARVSQSEEEMARMQLIIDQYTARLQTFEEMLDQREQNITDLSMSLYAGEKNMFDETDSEQVTELKQKLRHARQEVKELGPLRAEYRDCKSRVSILEKEKETLEAQLESMKSVGDESRLSIRSGAETRLRSRIDELEKEKRDLKAEVRSKAAEISKERRETEKSLRSEIADLKTIAMSEELDKKELARETERLKDVIHGLERDLIKATSEKTASRWGDYKPDEWQQKHRATLQELRQPKDEIAILRQLTGQYDDQASLRLRLPSGSLKAATSMAESKASKETPPKKYGEMITKEASSSASDDSAIDRSYDRKPLTITSASRANSRSGSPRKFTPPVLGFDAKPYGDIANSSLFPSLSKAKEEPAPAVTSQSRVPGSNYGNHTMDFGGETFASMRRVKASPRPSMVNFEISPGPAKRRAFAFREKPLASKAKGGVFGDPKRLAAAQRRLADRKAKRMADRLAAQAKVNVV